MKKKVIIIGAILLALSLSSLFFNSKKEVLLGDTIPTLQAWMIGAGNIITPRVSTNSVQIPSLASSGLCVATNASGTLISSACGTASATTTWGTIIGTLSNQTDLQNALNDKLSTTTAYSTYVPYSGSNSDLDLNAKNLKNFFISKIADATAKFTFDVSGLSSSTTRTLAVQDKSGTVALTSDLSAYLSTTTASSTYLKLDQTTPQTTVGTFSFPKVGANVIKPITDGTTAIQFTKADGTTTVMNLDTTNSLLNLTSFQNTASNWAINNSNMSFASGIPILWSSTGLYYNTKDVGLQRNAAGVLEINNSNAGTFADLKLRNLYTSGNVGIGTTTPMGKLQVNGPIVLPQSSYIVTFGAGDSSLRKIFGADTIGGTSVNYFSYIQSPDFDGNDGVQIRPYNGTITNAIATFLNGGNVGIGTTNPGALLHIVTPFARTDQTERIFSFQSSNDADLRVGLKTSFIGSATAVGRTTVLESATLNVSTGTFSNLGERLALNPDGGNVGIGNTNPLSKLQITAPSGDATGTGIMRFDTNSGTADTGLKIGAVAGAGNAGYSFLQGIHTNAASDGNIILNPVAGSVGIGTTAPNAKLSIQSTGADGINLMVDTGAPTWSTRLLFSNGTSGQGVSMLNTSGGLSFRTGASVGVGSGIEKMFLNSSGNLGIGTSTPSEILHVIGNGLFSGTLNASNLSGTNTGNESTTTIGVLIASSTATTTPADADLFAIYGSITSNLQNITWANLKSAILSYISSVTATFTNKRITPRVGSVTSSSTPIINTDNYDAYSITAQAGDITSFTTNLSGTPTNFQKLMIRIKDNGSARAITWGASFASGSATLPTTTTTGKTLLVGFIYDSVDSLWYCEAVGSRP